MRLPCSWKKVPTISPTVAKPELQDIGSKMLITQFVEVAELADAPDSTNRELQDLGNMLITKDAKVEN